VCPDLYHLFPIRESKYLAADRRQDQVKKRAQIKGFGTQASDPVSR